MRLVMCATVVALLVVGLGIVSAQGPDRASIVSVPIIEYVLPVLPADLHINAAGEIWFSSFVDNAIGRLDITNTQAILYPRHPGGNVGILKQDQRGNIWFATVNDEVIGALDPSSNTIFEWYFPRNHYGLDIEPVTDAIWFTTSENAPGIYRLSPESNRAICWSTFPYTRTFDLAIAPDGSVWFTVQPGANQAVGRLDPTTDQVTLWVPPTTNSQPFRLVAEAADEIWLTEYGAAANSLARLTPSRNLFSEFRIPTANSSPRGLARQGTIVWFAESGASTIGRLDAVWGVPRSSVVSPITFLATRRTITPIPSTFYTVTPQINPVALQAATATRTSANGFTEYALPAVGARPESVALDAFEDYVWFAEWGASCIGRMTTTSFDRNLLLPILLKGG